MSTLTELSIEHYRGFYKDRTIAPALPNGSAGSGLTVLVGPNNSGKSTVIAALQLVTGGRPRPIDMEHRHSNAQLRISVKNSDGLEKSITNPDLDARTVFQGPQSAYPGPDNIRIVPARRPWSAYTGQQSMDVNTYWFNAPQQAEDSNLVARLASFSVEQRKAFDSLSKELLPEVSSWKIELSRGQNFVLYETQAGAHHAADLFGDGMASLFRVSLAIVDSSPDHIIVIDEPELSLHPQAQKSLASVLSRYASDRQIVITSHSPYFVSWSDLSRGARAYRLTQTKEGISVGNLSETTISDLKGLMSDWQKPNLLDAVSREIFFADEVVYLEGQEDVGLLRKFSEDRGLPPLSAFGYGAGGFGNIKYFLMMAKDLGIPAAAVYDGDHADAKEEASALFPEAFIEVLPTPDIRDKPARDEHGKEATAIAKLGIFDKSGVIKPVHEEYLRDLLRRIRIFLKLN
jgi:predicted ATPase